MNPFLQTVIRTTTTIATYRIANQLIDAAINKAKEHMAKGKLEDK